MAKDDYHVIMYKILSYLYRQLKKGEPVDPAMLSHDSKTCEINISYWRYIMESLQAEGLIRGLEKGNDKDGDYIEKQLGQVMITPKGIELLNDNSTKSKVEDLLKNSVKGILRL